MEKMKIRFTAAIYQLILLMIISSCTSGGGSTKPANDWEKQNLKGEVKSLTETSYEVEEKFGEFVKGQKGRSNKEGSDMLFRFNPDGNLIEELYFDPYGSSFKRIYEFNDQSRSVGEKTSWAANDDVHEKFSSSKFYYDNFGNIVFKENYSSDSEFTGSDTLNYNEDGQLVELISYDADGKMYNKMLFKYTKDGRASEHAIYYADGSLVYKFSSEYDDHQKVKELHQEHDNLTINIFDQSQRIVERNTYKILNKANILNEDNLKQISSWLFKYDLDVQGNWIKQYHYKENAENPSYLVERDIEYY